MSFETAGQNPGLEIWRIEDFEAVALDEAKYGVFHVGDSYIVLKTTVKGSRTVWHLHFWLGSETSQDEAGTAAIKSVELDDQLGGSPIQHREVQGHESQLFLSYFRKGTKYLAGGVKSGFHHVDPDAVEKRLFQVKGKRRIKVKQVSLDASVLNTSDCWILDCGKGQKVLVYMPPGASKMENFQGIQAANQIRDEDHAGNATVEIIEELGEEFFSELGSEPAELSASEVSDEEAETSANNVKLYKVTDAGGDLEVTEMDEKPLKKSMLDPSDCFILNSGTTSGIFAWIGKEATKDEKAHAMEMAEKFLVKENLPKWTQVKRIVQGTETTMFKQYFQRWTDPEDAPFAGFGRRYPEVQIAEWDVADMHAASPKRLARSCGGAVGFNPDDGTGEKVIFRMENFEMVPLGDEAKGKFFGGDSYVIKYTYSKDGRLSHVVYFWQGEQSSQDEKAASAICAVQLDDELNGRATQVRVVQGSEPRHFVKMFDGNMVVYSGGKASGFKNVHDHDTYDVDGTMLFRVRGTCEHDVRTVQVQPENAASLNSEDVFILESPTNTWIWAGEASSEEEKEAAKKVAPSISPERDAEFVAESEEPDEFWEALGGKGEYRKALNLDRTVLDARLFHCKFTGSGKFRALEIRNFEQQDMASDDIMVLDSGAEIYIWIGNDATAEEKQKALDLAKKYLETDPTERNPDNTLIFTVKQGEEPSSFTCCFPSFAPWS